MVFTPMDINHVIIVNVASFQLNSNCDENKTNLLELSAIKLNTNGYKIESLFEDHARIPSNSSNKVHQKAKAGMMVPEILSVCNNVAEVLKSLQVWINVQSLENYPINPTSGENLISTKGTEEILKTSEITLDSNICKILWPGEPLKNFFIVTWGDWHFQEFLQADENIQDIPDYCQEWCNIKKIYKNHLNEMPSEVTLKCAMAKFGISGSDAHMPGLGICLAVAQIMAHLHEMGAHFFINGGLSMTDETTQNSKFQTDEKPFQITNGSGGECQANHQTSEENLGQSSSHIAARVPSAQQQNNWNSYLSYDSTKENSNAAAFCSVAQPSMMNTHILQSTCLLPQSNIGAALPIVPLPAMMSTYHMPVPSHLPTSCVPTNLQISNGSPLNKPTAPLNYYGPIAPFVPQPFVPLLSTGIPMLPPHQVAANTALMPRANVLAPFIQYNLDPNIINSYYSHYQNQLHSQFVQQQSYLQYQFFKEQEYLNFAYQKLSMQPSVIIGNKENSQVHSMSPMTDNQRKQKCSQHLDLVSNDTHNANSVKQLSSDNKSLPKFIKNCQSQLNDSRDFSSHFKNITGNEESVSKLEEKENNKLLYEGTNICDLQLEMLPSEPSVSTANLSIQNDSDDKPHEAWLQCFDITQNNSGDDSNENQVENFKVTKDKSADDSCGNQVENFELTKDKSGDDSCENQVENFEVTKDKSGDHSCENQVESFETKQNNYFGGSQLKLSETIEIMSLKNLNNSIFESLGSLSVLCSNEGNLAEMQHGELNTSPAVCSSEPITELIESEEYTLQSDSEDFPTSSKQLHEDTNKLIKLFSRVKDGDKLKDSSLLKELHQVGVLPKAKESSFVKPETSTTHPSWPLSTLATINNDTVSDQNEMNKNLYENKVENVNSATLSPINQTTIPITVINTSASNETLPELQGVKISEKSQLINKNVILLEQNSSTSKIQLQNPLLLKQQQRSSQSKLPLQQQELLKTQTSVLNPLFNPCQIHSGDPYFIQSHLIQPNYFYPYPGAYAMNHMPINHSWAHNPSQSQQLPHLKHQATTPHQQLVMPSHLQPQLQSQYSLSPLVFAPQLQHQVQRQAAELNVKPDAQPEVDNHQCGKSEVDTQKVGHYEELIQPLFNLPANAQSVKSGGEQIALASVNKTPEFNPKVEELRSKFSELYTGNSYGESIASAPIEEMTGKNVPVLLDTLMTKSTTPNLKVSAESGRFQSSGFPSTLTDGNNFSIDNLSISSANSLLRPLQGWASSTKRNSSSPLGHQLVLSRENNIASPKLPALPVKINPNEIQYAVASKKFHSLTNPFAKSPTKILSPTGGINSSHELRRPVAMQLNSEERVRNYELWTPPTSNLYELNKSIRKAPAKPGPTAASKPVYSDVTSLPATIPHPTIVGLSIPNPNAQVAKAKPKKSKKKKNK